MEEEPKKQAKPCQMVASAVQYGPNWLVWHIRRSLYYMTDSMFATQYTRKANDQYQKWNDNKKNVLMDKI